ncbi:hypothetical protein JOD47_003316 [Arthrobacter tumbae]|nr:hypothetical protein [Arthrobacter tumbae]
MEQVGTESHCAGAVHTRGFLLPEPVGWGYEECESRPPG